MKNIQKDPEPIAPRKPQEPSPYGRFHHSKKNVNEQTLWSVEYYGEMGLQRLQDSDCLDDYQGDEDTDDPKVIERLEAAHEKIKDAAKQITENTRINLKNILQAIPANVPIENVFLNIYCEEHGDNYKFSLVSEEPRDLAAQNKNHQEAMRKYLKELDCYEKLHNEWQQRKNESVVLATERNLQRMKQGKGLLGAEKQQIDRSNMSGFNDCVWTENALILRLKINREEAKEIIEDYVVCKS